MRKRLVLGVSTAIFLSASVLVAGSFTQRGEQRTDLNLASPEAASAPERSATPIERANTTQGVVPFDEVTTLQPNVETAAPPTTSTTAKVTIDTAPPPQPPLTTTPPVPSTVPPVPSTAPPVPSTVPTIPSQVSESDHFSILLRGDSEFWWDAHYTRQLASGGIWLDGDRAAYRCAYMFLEKDSQIVGRVTFARVVEASTYAMVNDRHMLEGIRFYDGSLAPNGSDRELGQCPNPSEAYEPNTALDERPTLTYLVNGQLVETRNYKTIEAGAGLVYQQVSKTSSRVTVVAYKDGLPVIVVYYDVLAPNAAITSDL